MNFAFKDLTPFTYQPRETKSEFSLVAMFMCIKHTKALRLCFSGPYFNFGGCRVDFTTRAFHVFLKATLKNDSYPYSLILGAIAFYPRNGLFLYSNIKMQMPH